MIVAGSRIGARAAFFGFTAAQGGGDEFVGEHQLGFGDIRDRQQHTFRACRFGVHAQPDGRPFHAH